MIIKEAVHFGLNRAMLARLGVMGCVSCGRRGLSTGQVILSRSAIYKMLVKDSNKRKKKHVGFDLPRVAETPTVVTESGSKAPKIPKYSSRLRNLNKVFLDNITDILSTGELASQLYGRGLELSQVSIHPNLQGINVYWVTTGNPEKDQETQELLNFHAKAVRHKLSNLRIIGHSPPIYFLRDDRQYKLQEVERLLAIADFGEDFEPTNPAHHLKADVPTLPVLLDTELKIHQSLKRARAEHRREVKIVSQASLLDHHPLESMSLFSNTGKQAIQKWANQYRQIQKKETCKKNKEAALLNYPGDLSYQDLQEEDMEVEWVEEEDYIDEFE